MRQGIAIGALGLLLCGPAVAGAVGRPAPRDTGVFAVDTATGQRTRITGDAGDASWARDGRSLYLSYPVKLGDPPHQTFEQRNLSGRRSLIRVLRTADIAERDMSVSPDGRRLAFLAAPRDDRHVNTGDLAVQPLAGGRFKRLLTRAFGTPAWSPDGRRLAVERWDEADARGDIGRGSRIVVVTVRTGAVRAGGAGGLVRWLPDGRLLYLTPGGRLVAGGRTVAGGVQEREGWAISPDGRALAVASGGHGVVVTDLATGASRQLAAGPANDVAWAPDGHALAALAGDRVLLLDPPRELARLPGRDLSALSWSPDGRPLALTARVPSPED